MFYGVDRSNDDCNSPMHLQRGEEALGAIYTPAEGGNSQNLPERWGYTSSSPRCLLKLYPCFSLKPHYVSQRVQKNLNEKIFGWHNAHSASSDIHRMLTNQWWKCSYLMRKTGLFKVRSNQDWDNACLLQLHPLVQIWGLRCCLPQTVKSLKPPLHLILDLMLSWRLDAHSEWLAHWISLCLAFPASPLLPFLFLTLLLIYLPLPWDHCSQLHLPHERCTTVLS